MWRGGLLAALLIVGLAAARPAPGQTLVPVAWINLDGAAARGNTLKNMGGPGSGGAAAQELYSGNGFVQVTVTDPTMDYVLSLGDTGAGSFIGGWALHMAIGGAEVREGNWTRKAAVSVARGDVLRIAVSSGKVKYMKNGTVFYTSANAPVYPLGVLASLWGFGATVSNANLSSTFTLAAQKP
jgi:hypothetical protein